jgi:thioesterase domain-containing protein
MQRVRDCANQAWKQYPPRFYDGKILFIHSETNSYFAADPIALWRGLAREIKDRKVSGDHIEILTTRFDILATVIFEELQRAFKENLLEAEPL